MKLVLLIRSDRDSARSACIPKKMRAVCKRELVKGLNRFTVHEVVSGQMHYYDCSVARYFL